MPRHYLRHPAEIPILLQQAGDPQPVTELSRELSEGGLSCFSDHYIAPGSAVDINIPLTHVPLTAKGHIIWCRLEDQGYLLGIGFDDPEQIYSVRMVEQVCQIESYRLQQRRIGRLISGEQAAHEWISLHAADFPPIEQLQ